MAKSASRSTPVTDEELMKPLSLDPYDRLSISLKDNDTEQFEYRVFNERAQGYTPSHAARYGFFERMPEKQEVKNSSGMRWIGPATDIAVQLVHNLWPEEQRVFDEDAAVVFQYLLVTVQHQQLAMQRSAEYHDFVARRKVIQQLAIPTPKFVEQFHFANDLEAMLHQNVGIMNSLHSDGFGGFMEQGTGKTPMTMKKIELCAKEIFEREGRRYRTLVVCPKNVRQNWVAEFRRFIASPGNATVIRGGPIERIEQFIHAMAGKNRSPDEIYTTCICSYECLWSSWDIIGQLPWDLAVLDESHYIKWPYTKRSKFAHKLRDVANARIALTGTPVCNTPIDLYSQLEFLRKGGSGFHSFDAFKKFYGVYETKGDGRSKRLVDVQNLPWMRERLARMCHIVTKAEALPDLPPLTHQIREVEMTQEQRQVYEAVSKQLFYEIKNEMDDSTKTVNANNILVKMLRLAQITSGFVCYSPTIDLDTGETLAPGSLEDFVPNPKLELLMDILRGSKDRSEEDDEYEEPRPADEKTLIWAHWIHDVEMISARLEEEGIDHVTYTGSTSDDDRAEAERRFNFDRDCRVFLGSAGAGGTGLNLLGYPPGQPHLLETDATMAIYYSQDWSQPKRTQSSARNNRSGTRRPTTEIDLCIPNTIDEEIRARVLDKKRVAMDVQNLREVLSKVLGRQL